jgi:hypothetical protein
MSLDKIIKFNMKYNNKLRHPKITFNPPVFLKNFSIKSNKKLFFNLYINQNHLIYYDETEQTEKYLTTLHDGIDGHHYNFNFLKDIYIRTIELNVYDKHHKFDNYDVYLEYDEDHLELIHDTDKIDLYYDAYNFQKKYFKFNNIIDDIELVGIYEIKYTYYTNNSESRKIVEDKLDESLYKFSHLKNNTYCVEFIEEQNKKFDYIYNFNNNDFISSYYQII